MSDLYDHLSRYYDQSQASMTEDIPFILSLAADKGSPILELGCGSGRLLLPLVRAGYNVTGLDNSPAMLALAKARLGLEEPGFQVQVRLVAADMSRPFLTTESGTMTLVVVGINTFMHLNEVQCLTMLREVARLLQPGGLLFIDVDNPFALAEVDAGGALEEEQRWADPATGHIIRQSAAYQAVAGNQMVDVQWLFEEETASGEIIDRQVLDMRYHFTYPHQFDLLLSRTGLRLTALFGDYTRVPFSESSDRLLLLATRV